MAMEKNTLKLTLAVLALTFLAAGMLQPAQAVDITFYNGRACSGLFAIVRSARINVCFSRIAYAIRISGLDRCKQGIVYRGRNCAVLVLRSRPNVASVCFTSATPFTSAKWIGLVGGSPPCPVQTSLPEATTPQAISAVGYTAGTAEWVLNSENAAGLLSQAQALPAADQLAFLQAQGAALTP